MAENQSPGKRAVPGSELSAGKAGLALDRDVGPFSEKSRYHCSLIRARVDSDRANAASCSRSDGVKVCVYKGGNILEKCRKSKYLSVFMMSITLCKRCGFLMLANDRFIFLFWFANWLESALASIQRASDVFVVFVLYVISEGLSLKQI